MGASSSILGLENDNGDESCWKRRGDEAFRLGLFEESVAHYTRCIVSLASDDVERMGTVLSNRAAAFLNNDQPLASLQDSRRVLECKPTWPKGYYRASLACLTLKRYEEANDFIAKGIGLSPHDKTMHALREQILSEDAAGRQGTPVFKGTGNTYMWGSNDFCQLGHGKGVSAKSRPVLVDALRGKIVVEMSCGSSHTVCSTHEGEIWTWGDNKHLQLGLGNVAEIEQQCSPVLVPSLVGIFISAISCGAGHTVAISSDGRVYAWGMGGQGQLGLGDEVAAAGGTSTPLRVPLNDECAAVSAGIAHTCLLLQNNDGIIAFGYNNYGQLGLGEDAATCVASPVAVPLPSTKSKITHVSCGGAHTLFLLEDGSLYASGSNSCGQLGTGDQADAKHFQKSLSKGFDDISFVCAGEEYSIAVRKDTGKVLSFGLNICGQLGQGDTEKLNIPTEIEGLVGVETISVSQSQVFAICANGDVFTWGGLAGDVSSSSLLLDATDAILSPMKLKIFSQKRKRVKQLVCGRRHYGLIVRGTCHVSIIEICLSSFSFLTYPCNTHRGLRTELYYLQRSLSCS